MSWLRKGNIVLSERVIRRRCLCLVFFMLVLFVIVVIYVVNVLIDKFSFVGIIKCIFSKFFMVVYVIVC